MYLLSKYVILDSLSLQLSYIVQYRIAGNFSERFNLAIWRFDRMSPMVKLYVALPGTIHAEADGKEYSGYYRVV